MWWKQPTTIIDMIVFSEFEYFKTIANIYLLTLRQISD